jgi:hypothetical protein
MTATGAQFEAVFPYTDLDIEVVETRMLRPGDVLAGRGPQGTGRWLGRRITAIDRRPGGAVLFRAADMTGDGWVGFYGHTTFVVRPDSVRWPTTGQDE